MPLPSKLPDVGDTVADRFELRRVLGEGGMGVVYEALDRRRDRPCAIKILFPHYADKPELVARFDREAHIAAKLQGPNVARVFDVGALPGGVRYIAMELLVGRDLRSELDERRRLPRSTAVDIVLQAARAMEEAHAAGVIHRDLKPENLFLTTSGGRSGTRQRPIVKVLDFGISRLLDDKSNRLTKDLAQLGTPVYMSPEQIESAALVDQRTDIWALGIVLYEMLAGRPPFDAQGTAVLVAVATRPLPPPSTFVDDLPPELESVVMRALEKSPDARFQSMGELARSLAPWAPADAARQRRGWKTAVLLGAMAAAAAGIAAASYDVRSALAPLLGNGAPSLSSAPSAVVTASPPPPPSHRPSSASPGRRAPPARGSLSSTATAARPPRPPSSPKPRRP